MWLATEDLKIGDRFRTKIDEAIRLYDKLLLVDSKNSVGSPWVESEVEAAFEKERKQKRTVLFPIRLDPMRLWKRGKRGRLKFGGHDTEAISEDGRTTINTRRHSGDYCAT